MIGARTLLPVSKKTNKHTNQSLYLDAFESAPTPNAVGTGWGGTTAGDDEDPWGAFEDPTPPPVPIPVTELTSSSPPTVTAARTSSARPARVAALTPSSSPRASPLASPAMSEGTALPIPASPVPGKVVGMTKEEKAAEMARRKEERKQVRLSVSTFLLFFVSELNFFCFGSSEDCTVEGTEEEYCWHESVAVESRVEDTLCTSERHAYVTRNSYPYTYYLASVVNCKRGRIKSN